MQRKARDVEKSRQPAAALLRPGCVRFGGLREESAGALFLCVRKKRKGLRAALQPEAPYLTQERIVTGKTAHRRCADRPSGGGVRHTGAPKLENTGSVAARCHAQETQPWWIYRDETEELAKKFSKLGQKVAKTY